MVLFENFAYILLVKALPGTIALEIKLSSPVSHFNCKTITFLESNTLVSCWRALSLFSIGTEVVCVTVLISIPKNSMIWVAHSVFSMEIGKLISAQISRNACTCLLHNNLRRAMNRNHLSNCWPLNFALF